MCFTIYGVRDISGTVHVIRTYVFLTYRNRKISTIFITHNLILNAIVLYIACF